MDFIKQCSGNIYPFKRIELSVENSYESIDNSKDILQINELLVPSTGDDGIVNPFLQGASFIQNT